MRKYLFLFHLLLLAGACSVEEVGELSGPIVNSNNQEAAKAVVIESLKQYQLRFPAGLIKNGQLVVINDLENTENVYEINLSDQKIQAYYPRVRTRSGGVTLMSSLSADAQGGWTAFDCESRQLTGNIATPSTRSGEGSGITLPEGVQHLWAVPAGDYVLATGLYEQGRYLLYSPATETAGYYVSYPDHPEYTRLKEKTKSILHASNVLKVRPDNNAFVCADMYSGSMDIGRITGGKVELVRRLCWHAPKVQIKERRKWPLVAYSRDNKFGFTDVAVTNERIDALYSGRTYREYQNKFQRCRTLLELDWEGNVLRSFALDTEVTHISYDTQEKALYGIAYRPEMTLVRLDIE